MRYMILIGHDEKGGKNLSEAEHQALFTAYQKYETDLRQAGVLLGGDPLQPSARGARITTDGGKRKVLDGPFTESKEIIGGYVLIEVKSRPEALEWASRCPAGGPPSQTRPPCRGAVRGPTRCRPHQERTGTQHAPGTRRSLRASPNNRARLERQRRIRRRCRGRRRRQNWLKNSQTTGGCQVLFLLPPSG